MRITIDGKLQIATGLSAQSKVWANKNTSWGSLVERLQAVTITAETFSQYKKANKDEKSKIKDVGGYVGGYLRGGRRKPENVMYRQLLTLDLDYANLEFWDDFTLTYGNAAVLHSTHSHTPESPRFRLIMPLSREVQGEEYEAIARRLAGSLDIDLFDDTTFQVNRLMFWPSVSKDVDYYIQIQDGEWLDVDEVLSSYFDWQDRIGWPISSRVDKAVRKLSEKQQDPHDKKGIIGLFCRAFTIQEAIDKHLPETYTRVTDNIYTYVHGSTSGGLKIYDDKFAYSYHGTDPISGKLCNAFDLVRLHKFGHLDPNPTSKVSFKEMEELARQDEEVKIVMAKESIIDAKYDFDQLPIDDEEDEENTEENLDWAKELEVDNRGNYLSNSTNLNLIFRNDKNLKGAFRYNSFNGKRYVCKDLAWRKLEDEGEQEPIKNADYSGIRNYIETIYGIASPMKIDDALALEFQRHTYNPVEKYLNDLVWDGKKRIDRLLVDYFGADDNIYHREAIRKPLVAAVARIYEAGTKFDLVLTLVGSQGSGKSTFIRKLGNGWASDSFSTVTGKEAFEQLQGAWLIEIAELSGLRKAEVEAIKHFISKQEDTYRPAYGRSSETFKRQCVFFGTTNNDGFLNDPTGNRRFMPVDVVEEKIKKSPFNITQEEIDQIWAEAKHLYQNGEKLYLSNKADEIAKAEQKGHIQQDSRKGLIEEFLDTKLPTNWEAMDIYERRAYLNDPLSGKGGTEYREYITTVEIWCELMEKNKEDLDKYRARDINDILKNLDGWESVKQLKYFNLYGRQRCYRRKLT